MEKKINILYNNVLCTSLQLSFFPWKTFFRICFDGQYYLCPATIASSHKIWGNNWPKISLVPPANDPFGFTSTQLMHHRWYKPWRGTSELFVTAQSTVKALMALEPRNVPVIFI